MWRRTNGINFGGIFPGSDCLRPLSHGLGHLKVPSSIFGENSAFADTKNPLSDAAWSILVEISFYGGCYVLFGYC